MNDTIGKFFNFQGRIGRLTYFLYTIVLVASIFVLCLLAMIPLLYCAVNDQRPYALVFVFTIGAICSIGIAGLVSSLSIIFRRLHDLNLSGCWIFAIWVWSLVVAFVNYQLFGSTGNFFFKLLCYLPSVILLFIKGTNGPNTYGKDPLLEQEAE
jgi:uncharacterized membrane protein YhaH (DUF805 family)